MWGRKLSNRSRHVGNHVGDADRAITRAVGALPPSGLDETMKRLSHVADHSLLWFGIAAVLAARRGTTRKAAARGVLSIAAASCLANAVLKPLTPRRRPPAAELPACRTLPHPPTSSSFPSGHAASAAAFATAVTMESPRMGAVVVPLAAAVAYSRVHGGVHWASDVLAGAALGTGVALATQRWWPLRTSDEARARPVDKAPELPGGRGLLLISNQRSGNPDYDPAADLTAAFPDAIVLHTEPDTSIADQLDEALESHAGQIRAIGAAGGDGTLAAAAAVASRWGLPLMVVPTGTLNHFARDVGVYDLQEAVDATGAGEAVAVDLGVVEMHPGHGSDPETPAVSRVVYFLNTASLGSYPDLVRLRERWQVRWGKWPAFAAALYTVLRRAKPVDIKIDGRWRSVWVLFVGNGPYHPKGMVPAWRSSLDSGLLDVRLLRADVRLSRLRAALLLLFGAFGHSRVYQEWETPELDVELAVPGMLATDGEVVGSAGRYTFRVAEKKTPVYRRDEAHWPDRDRPFQRT